MDHRWKKKYTINAARDACPDGKEYLSGPRENGTSSEVGRLLLVIAFIKATDIISSNKPEIIFLFMYILCIFMYIYVYEFNKQYKDFIYLLEDLLAFDTSSCC